MADKRTRKLRSDTGDKRSPLKAGQEQVRIYIATHASPIARNFFIVLIELSTFPVHSPSFFSKRSPYVLLL